MDYACLEEQVAHVRLLHLWKIYIVIDRLSNHEARDS